MALNVVQYEDILSLLRQVPLLVDRLEARKSDFPSDVLAWLKRTEEALESNHLAVVSLVSSYRAMLIEAARGVQIRDVTFVGKRTNRKAREATASMALQGTSELLHAVIKERQQAFEEAERVSRQVLVVAEAKGLLAACGGGLSHQEFLMCLRAQVAADADLANLYLHLVALVGKSDMLVFLDRALAKIS